MKSALLLLSTGIDSPVAAHMMQQNKGFSISAVHFDNFNDKEELERLKKIAKIIGLKKIIVIDHKKAQKEFRKNCNERFQCLLCKRFMYKVSEKIAKEKKISYLLTGESLGQVGSQTLENLVVLDSSIDMHVLRPLLGFDKQEAIDIAKEIGTFKISTKKALKCPYVPRSPLTKGRVEKVKKEEERVDMRHMVDYAVENSYEIDV